MWHRKPPNRTPLLYSSSPGFSTSTLIIIIIIIAILFSCNFVQTSKISNSQQTRAIPPTPSNYLNSASSPAAVCPVGCECDTPSVVSCISARLIRLPLRLPSGTKFFYAEHNRFATPVLSHRNFTNYVGPSGRPTLVGMSLHNCSLQLIGFRTFTSLKSLQELDLSNNKISVIEDNTFNGLNLNMLDLSYNVGIQFSKQAFCGCTIRRLALRAVGLKTFDLTTFSFIFANLMSLSVADNRLLTLDYRIFSCAPNLSTVYFARNPWWCGGDCSTLQLINHVNSHVSDLVLDEAPSCQPGYEEQQDLNKAECAAKIALINQNNNTLPECPITVITASQSSGRSLTPLSSSDAPYSAGKHDDELASADGGFVTWSDGVLANYTRPVTLAPGVGAAKGSDDTSNVIVLPTGGGCYKLSTVVAASTMASVATLVIVLSMCLCVRACYLRCQHSEPPSAQNVYHSQLKTNNNNNNGHHKNGTSTNGNGNGVEYKPINRNGSTTNGGMTTLVPSQGQPLLMHSGSESSAGSGHHLNGNSRHNRILVS